MSEFVVPEQYWFGPYGVRVPQYISEVGAVFAPTHGYGIIPHGIYYRDKENKDPVAECFRESYLKYNCVNINNIWYYINHDFWIGPYRTLVPEGIELIHSYDDKTYTHRYEGEIGKYHGKPYNTESEYKELFCKKGKYDLWYYVGDKHDDV